MGQAQINVRTRACSGTFIARTKQAALTHKCKGEKVKKKKKKNFDAEKPRQIIVKTASDAVIPRPR